MILSGQYHHHWCNRVFYCVHPLSGSCIFLARRRSVLIDRKGPEAPPSTVATPSGHPVEAETNIRVRVLSPHSLSTREINVRFASECPAPTQRRLPTTGHTSRLHVHTYLPTRPCPLTCCFARSHPLLSYPSRSSCRLRESGWGIIHGHRLLSGVHTDLHSRFSGLLYGQEGQTNTAGL